MSAPTFARGAEQARRIEAGSVRRNGFSAACISCGQMVPSGEGELSNRSGKWTVKHLFGCPEPVREDAPAPVTSGVGDGYYTIIRPDGSYRTLRLRTQDEDEQFMPGKQIIGYLSGSNNDRDYTNFGHIDGDFVRVWKRFQYDSSLMSDSQILLGDSDKAREAYALESGRCSRCNRTLTRPESITGGLGPECAKMI